MIVPLCQRRDIQEEPLVQISQTSVYFRKFKENNGSGLHIRMWIRPDFL